MPAGWLLDTSIPLRVVELVVFFVCKLKDIFLCCLFAERNYDIGSDTNTIVSF